MQGSGFTGAFAFGVLSIFSASPIPIASPATPRADTMPVISDGMKILVTGIDERLQIVSLFDNLGKGSSGAALQCLNLMTGMNETMGLNL